MEGEKEIQNQEVVFHYKDISKIKNPCKFFTDAGLEVNSYNKKNNTVIVVVSMEKTNKEHQIVLASLILRPKAFNDLIQKNYSFKNGTLLETDKFRYIKESYSLYRENLDGSSRELVML